MTASETGDKALDAQAFELLDAGLESGQSSDAQNAALEAFAAQSPEHAAALARARSLKALSEALPRSETRARPSWALQSNLILARVLERPVAISAVVFVLLGTLISLTLQPSTSETPQIVQSSEPSKALNPETIETVGQQSRRIELADGSVVWLGWRSRISVQLGKQERSLLLEQGVAAFDVATHDARPFVVVAGPVRAAVTGTEFVVNRQQEEQVEVAVMEGGVAVSRADTERTRLTAGQVATLASDRPVTVSRQDVDEMGAWRDGLLLFRDRPLLEALRALSAWTGRRLDASAIEGHPGRVSGLFYLEQADEALETLMQTHRLRAEESPQGILLLQPARVERGSGSG